MSVPTEGSVDTELVGVSPTVVHDPTDHDGGEFASHHTLGRAHTQAAFGDHLHMLGQTIVGSPQGNPALISLLNLLAITFGLDISNTLPGAIAFISDSSLVVTPAGGTGNTKSAVVAFVCDSALVSDANTSGSTVIGRITFVSDSSLASIDVPVYLPSVAYASTSTFGVTSTLLTYRAAIAFASSSTLRPDATIISSTGTIFGTSRPGYPRLVTSVVGHYIRCYGPGDLVGLPSNTVVCYSATGIMTPANITALKAATSSAAAICQTLINYFTDPNINDLIGIMLCLIHEPDNNTNGIPNASDHSIIWQKFYQFCVPSINAHFVNNPLYGPIFTSGWFKSHGLTLAQIDAWVSGYNPDFIGWDPYHDETLFTDPIGTYQTHSGIPWAITEFGYTVNSPGATDTQSLTHLQNCAALATSPAAGPAALAFMYYDNNWNIMDTTLSQAVSASATQFNVNSLGVRTFLAGSKFRIVDANPAKTETVTLSATTVAGSLVVNIVGSPMQFSHLAGTNVYLLPNSVDFLRSN